VNPITRLRDSIPANLDHIGYGGKIIAMALYLINFFNRPLTHGQNHVNEK